MKKQLKIKVCGMKFPENREAVSELPIDMLGFIFYPPSKRHVGDLPAVKQSWLFDTSKEKVGVFVNEFIENISVWVQKFELGVVQLHGDESPEYCNELKSTGVKIIKAFRINESFNFSIPEKYTNVADLFLFDTKAEQPGGTGKKFDWHILDNYNYTTPFLLSGGIHLEDAEKIKELTHPSLYGVDLNSGFEDKPGLKNTKKLEEFIKILNRQK